MNQASRASEVVPVLPATGRSPSWARVPVPPCTTCVIIQISCPAASGEITRAPMPPDGPINASPSPFNLRSRIP